jgi:hypothetical protein
LRDEPTIHYSIDHARWELLQPSADGEHVWTAMAVYRISAEQARAAYDNPDGSDPAALLYLDQENLANIMVGCFACEKPYSKRLSYRRCKGEPSDETS